MLRKYGPVLVNRGKNASPRTLRSLLDRGIKHEGLAPLVDCLLLWPGLNWSRRLVFMRGCEMLGLFLVLLLRLLLGRLRLRLLLLLSLRRRNLVLWLGWTPHGIHLRLRGRRRHVLNRLRGELRSRRLWGRHRMSLHRLHLWLGREIRRQRRPSLVLHVRLHLVGVRLWWGIWVLRMYRGHGVRWHVGLHVGGVLRIVDGWLGHKCVAVHLRLRLSRTDRLANHGGTHPPDVVPGRRPGAHTWLGRVTPWTVSGMLDKDTIGNWRRC